nr:cobalamin biosynthesis protein [uncultured Rhodopila sp.]
MTGPIAIGVGCRLGCPADAIEALVRQALEQAPASERLGLFTISDKAQEPGLSEAATRLGLDLIVVNRDALREQSASVQTRSPHAERRFGVPSVAEAAALAGAGAGSILLVPRIAGPGATCAIAGVRP